MKRNHAICIFALAVTATVLAPRAYNQEKKEAGDAHKIVHFGDLKWTPILKGCDLAPVYGDPGAEGAPPQMGVPPKAAVPQSIPPRLGAKLRTTRQVNWGWVLALVMVVLALAAIAILGTVLLTRSKHSKVSEEDQVRHTIQQYDVAVQRGDLTSLRTVTCGTVRDGYVDYDEHAWQETYQRVSAAKQYPVIASIDQVVVNGQHAEANITTFMAYDPSLRSTRSLDLQYRDDQWKICQSPSG